MTTTTTKKTERFLRWLARIAPGTGILRIRIVYSATRTEEEVYSVRPGEEASTYILERLAKDQTAPSGYGTGIAAAYTVFLDFYGPGEHCCTCPGHASVRHHDNCKHAGALSTLREQGKL